MSLSQLIHKILKNMAFVVFILICLTTPFKAPWTYIYAKLNSNIISQEQPQSEHSWPSQSSEVHKGNSPWRRSAPSHCIYFTAGIAYVYSGDLYFL